MDTVKAILNSALVSKVGQASTVTKGVQWASFVKKVLPQSPVRWGPIRQVSERSVSLDAAFVHLVPIPRSLDLHLLGRAHFVGLERTNPNKVVLKKTALCAVRGHTRQDSGKQHMRAVSLVVLVNINLGKE
jgi:hypothetical protein